MYLTFTAETKQITRLEICTKSRPLQISKAFKGHRKYLGYHKWASWTFKPVQSSYLITTCITLQLTGHYFVKLTYTLYVNSTYNSVYSTCVKLGNVVFVAPITYTFLGFHYFMHIINLHNTVPCIPPLPPKVKVCSIGVNNCPFKIKPLTSF